MLVTQPESATAAHGFRYSSANIYGFTPAPTIERGLAQELNGEVHLKYDPSGVSCEIDMPVPKGEGWRSHE
jgi:hypothetical protein